jgi:hypothetical protein
MDTFNKHYSKASAIFPYAILNMNAAAMLNRKRCAQHRLMTKCISSLDFRLIVSYKTNFYKKRFFFNIFV